MRICLRKEKGAMTQEPIATLHPRSKPELTLHLFHCTLADKYTIRSLFLNCFTEIVSRTVFPPDEAVVHEWWDKTLDEELQDPEATFLKVLAVDSSADANHKNDRIVAFGKWNVPNDEKEYDENSAQLPTWPDLGGERGQHAKRVADDFYGGMSRGHARTIKQELGSGPLGHWYLEMLGTLPEYRGLGAAGLMVKWGLDQADREKRIAFLESAPGAVPLYHKVGFEDRGRVDVKVDDQNSYYNVFMVRQPRAIS